MSNERFLVRHEPDQTRFALVDQGEDGAQEAVIGEERYLDVVSGGATERVMFHTEVSKDYGGQGLASVLVRAAVEQTIAAGAKVVPVCPYVVKWLEKHTEFSDHVVKATPDHLRALG